MDPEKSIAEYKRRILMAMDYIHKNLDANPSLDEIAEAAMFSKFHFHRIFQMLVGETTAQFTRRLRLEKAANMLVYKNRPDITTVALECGFSSSQNFAKAFRKHFNLSPSEYQARFSKIGNTDSKQGNDAPQNPGYDAELFHWDAKSYQRSGSMNVEIKTMPDYYVAYVRQIGPYGPEICMKAEERLMRWAGPRGYFPGGLGIGISWDNPTITPPERCRYDACVTVPDDVKGEGEVGVQTIPGGLYAVYHVRINTDEFGRVWNELMGEWLPQSGYQCDDRPCYEICRNNVETDPEHKWEVDVCCPITPL